MPKSAKPDKQRLAYETIYSRIVDGQYGPGYRLVIDALARELGMTQTPIREAIRRLQEKGVVTYSRNFGATVATIDEGAYADALSLLALLEGYATRDAAPHLTGDDLDTLASLNDAMREALRDLDIERFNALNRQFHQTIYARCSNAYLLRLLEETWERLDALRRTIFHFIPRRSSRSIDEHEALIQLIRGGASPEKTEHFAREHKQHTLRAFREWRERSPNAAPGAIGRGSG